MVPGQMDPLAQGTRPLITTLLPEYVQHVRRCTPPSSNTLAVTFSMQNPERDEVGGYGALPGGSLCLHCMRTIQIATAATSINHFRDLITSGLRRRSTVTRFTRHQPELENFRAYAEVSKLFRSQIMGEALFEFFMTQIDSIVAQDPKAILLWCHAIGRSHMNPANKEECYQALLEEDDALLGMFYQIPSPLAQRVADNIARAMPERRMSRYDNPGRDPVRGTRPRSYSSSGINGGSALGDILGLNNRQQYRSRSRYQSPRSSGSLMHYRGRRRGLSVPGYSRRLDDEIELIEEAADTLLRFAPDLAQLRLEDGR